MNLADLRREYTGRPLDTAHVDPDPMVQMQQWLDEAVDADVPDPTAMTLATADAEGRPAARIVLLKQLDEAGLVFYTHYDSDKGRDLEANPRAAVVFYWHPLNRQIRVTGRVERISAAESDAYFATRPYGARISAAASPQSKPVPDRAALEQRRAKLENQHPDGDIPRPAEWGGYRIHPNQVEFWQGRENRLHDRVRYDREGDSWRIGRLAS